MRWTKHRRFLKWEVYENLRPDGSLTRTTVWGYVYWTGHPRFGCERAHTLGWTRRTLSLGPIDITTWRK